jgi:hypothetical protein
MGDVDVAPPAIHGDVERTVRGGYRRIVLVDGLFYHQLTVGHREIRMALEANVEVIGLGSLGAIRAAELAGQGMAGFGQVYEAYRSDPDLSDDEVALLHEPTEPYRPLSEPLIHLRSWILALKDTGTVSAPAAERAIKSLRCRWFGDRTVHAACAVLAEHSGVSVEQSRVWTRGLGEHQLKLSDWRRFETGPLTQS